MQHITHRLTSAANMQREICDLIGPRISAVMSHTCPTEQRDGETMNFWRQA